MSGMSLGQLLAEAGVKGAKKKPTITIEEIRALAKINAEPTFPNEAMEHLPAEFQSLKTISKGEEFTRELVRLIQMLIDNGKSDLITEHVIYGVTQIAHHHRDRLSGSKRSSFKKIIPTLLEAKSQMIKKQPTNLAEFLLKKIK